MKPTPAQEARPSAGPTLAPAKPPAAGQAAHTPMPWHVVNGNEIISKEGWAVADAFPTEKRVQPEITAEQDAAFIVRACNSHAGLRGLAVLCNAYLEPIADQLEICHKQPHEAKALRQLLDMARKELAALQSAKA